jgi:DNA-binding MarR family transcriptional regulator
MKNICCEPIGGACCDGDLIEDIVGLIDKLYKKFSRLSGGVVGDHGITPSQYYILNILWNQDGIPLNELASQQCCSRSTITGIIDTMEKNDLVFRDRTGEDRRVILVRLTEKGKSLKSELSSVAETLSNCCVGGLKADEFVQLKSLLERLNATVPGC